jgi:hypothetical protein
VYFIVLGFLKIAILPPVIKQYYNENVISIESKEKPWGVGKA